MPIKLKQIPSLLHIVKQFEGNNKIKPLASVIKKTYNNSPVSEAVFPDFDKVGSFCVKAGILKLDQNLLTLTNLGYEILSNYEDNQPINENLKKIFAEKCFLSGLFAPSVQEGLSYFISENDQHWYPAEMVLSIFSDQEILALLYECGILELKDERVIVNPKYAKLMRIVKKEQKTRISQKQIDSQLKLMKQVGEIAEEIVFDYEVKRLRDQSCTEESKNVQRISQSFANAGYDVKSFHNKAADLNQHDMFIEVKGSTNNEFDIHWSENEVKTAEELGEKYWVYFVGGIDVQGRKTHQKPLTIQNPFQKILKSSDYHTEVESYHITKKDKNK